MRNTPAWAPDLVDSFKRPAGLPLQTYRLVNGKLELAQRFTPPPQDDPYDPPPMRERDRMLPAAE